MAKILYTVRTTVPTPLLHRRYLAWLVPDHIAAVKAGGAESVRVALVDRASEQSPFLIEVQYIFPSRTAFDGYVRDHAPALRADSLTHFPSKTGVRSERQIAEIEAELN